MLQYFPYLTLIIGIIPILLFWKERKKINTEAYYFLPFIILLAVATIYEYIGTLILKMDVTSWFWIYLLLEFYTLSYFFYKLSINKRLSLFFAFAFLVLYLILANSLKPHNALLLEGYLSTFSFIAFLFFIFIWFRNLFKELTYPNLFDNNLFYFIIGIMFYFAGTIFLFLLSDYLYKNQKESFTALWMLNVLFSFIFRILIIIGIWKSRKT